MQPNAFQSNTLCSIKYHTVTWLGRSKDVCLISSRNLHHCTQWTNFLNLDFLLGRSCEAVKLPLKDKTIQQNNSNDSVCTFCQVTGSHKFPSSAITMQLWCQHLLLASWLWTMGTRLCIDWEGKDTPPILPPLLTRWLRCKAGIFQQTTGTNQALAQRHANPSWWFHRLCKIRWNYTGKLTQHSRMIWPQWFSITSFPPVAFLMKNKLCQGRKPGGCTDKNSHKSDQRGHWINEFMS